MPKMIFHTPYPLNREATAASGIRPVRMRDAFEQLGYEVTEITGYSAERRSAIKDVKRRIRAGEKFEFVYSESSTMPTALTDPHRLPLHPRFDLSFLGFCKRNGVPTGVFYRDIYWNTPAYLESVSRVVAAGTRTLYRSDLRRYRSVITRIFVPSLKMASVMPHTDLAQCTALPPASDPVETEAPRDPASMFYVGALGHYYRLHEAVRAFEQLGPLPGEAGEAGEPGEAPLTLCTSAALWESKRAEYEPIMTHGATKVVHASGAQLEPHYQRSALGCLFMEPIAYREFAAPLKLYEYLAHGRPVVATEGSLAAQFVAENGVGWVVPYSAEALRGLLARLRADTEEYEAVAERVRQVRQDHSWAARAAQAAAALGA